ncbi:MAG: nitroreductase family protein [Acholeplasmataceae bacterium]|nr:nitroreductase family protein [Acholeplasmataceae bacterium]
MKTIEAILTRKSVREYSDKPIEEEVLQTILKAGQAGPSARNRRDWHFLVVQDSATLKNMAGLIGLLVASPLLHAKMAILVLGDEKLSADDFWKVDCSIAAQNMILAAHELGIGACWIGTFPKEGKMKIQKEIFHLPNHIIPHSIITFGYPKDDTNFFSVKEGKPILEEDKIHREKW